MPQLVQGYPVPTPEVLALLDAASVSVYHDIVDEGHTWLISPEDGYVDAYTDEPMAEVAPCLAFSLRADGDDSYVGSADSFYLVMGTRVWNYERAPEYDCYECSDNGCHECRDEDTYDPYGEESSDDSMADTSRLHIKALKARPARMTSVEIEVGMGGNYLAEAFHGVGLSSTDYMGGYHDMSDDNFVRVEEDSSVAAEVIFSKMRLDNLTDARKFEQGIGIIRTAIDDGRSKLDMRCGLHIHVNLGHEDTTKALSMDGVASLYHLWNYLEDTIFRLGSANWKGHRSEFGNDYAPITQKGMSNNAEIGRTMQHGRGALNLSNYLCARGNCRCGAFDFGSWQDCTCNLGRSTVEFRVFNTSANSRKIRAYIALVQALVGAAESKRFGPDDYPVFEWTESGEPDVLASKERLEFILNELPLTNDERQDILYCAEKSSLHTVLDQEHLRVLWNNNN